MDEGSYATSYGNIDFSGAKVDGTGTIVGKPATDTIVRGMQIGLGTFGTIFNADVGTSLPYYGDCFVGSAKDGCNPVPLEYFLDHDDD